MKQKKPNKIYILGTVGSGKTVLARQLSNKLKIKQYELDTLYWKRKYDLKTKREERNAKLKAIAKTDRWIMEGVYSTWTEQAIKKSDLIIILDIAFPTLCYRILKRYIVDKINGKNDPAKDIFTLIRYAWKYRRSKGSTYAYAWELRLIKKYKKKHRIIRTKKELNYFVQTV